MSTSSTGEARHSKTPQLRGFHLGGCSVNQVTALVHLNENVEAQHKFIFDNSISRNIGLAQPHHRYIHDCRERGQRVRLGQVLFDKRARLKFGFQRGHMNSKTRYQQGQGPYAGFPAQRERALITDID